MGIGGSVLLLAVGAILAFATDWELSGVDLDMVGIILMAAGAIGLAAFLSIFRRRRAVPPTAQPPVVEERSRYYDGY
ncbi:DUF6458 family protein [Streptomyces sp. NPDC051940]|uniref:DUF6458 family protein n=1 Tax=Streptomyces sp. NPDC051940 TaxID=3155675 RepID=UPI003445E6C1